MPCLHCAQCTSQILSPYSRRLPAVPGVYHQHTPACTDNLEDSQQMRSPPSSYLLCSCIPFIFHSRYLGQVHPPTGSSGKKKKKKAHSSLSTWRCSASAKGARTEACYLPSTVAGGRHDKSRAICTRAEAHSSCLPAL